MAIAETNGTIPFHYAKYLTAAILDKIRIGNPELAKKLHDNEETYQNGPKQFKPLSHSWLIGLEKQEDGFKPINKQINFYLGWRDDVIESFKRGLEQDSTMNIGGTEITVTMTVDLPCEPVTNTYQTLSPIWVTYQSQDILYKDNPAMFVQLLGNNLRAKYKAVYRKEYAGKLYLIFHQTKTIISKWGDFWVGANWGKLVIDADYDMQKLALGMGLGKGNAIGFGVLDTAI